MPAKHSSQIPLLPIVFLLLTLPAATLYAQATPLQLPAGFQATLFVGDDLATNIQCMTTNTAGQIVVSGPGYIKILLDENGDGVADSARLFASGPHSGAQGLFVDGQNYYCIGDAGLLRYTDKDADGQADGPPELVMALRAGGEHYAHALRKGPDGWWYLIAGNEAEINSTTINTARSPLLHPQAGVLVRFSPDFSVTEVLADGYRNAYDFDFTQEGDLFTYDSDGEREISLPFYRPTRVFHTITGMNHGWVSPSWKKPNYFAEMSPVMAELGRGSPTGVVAYRHQQFPPEFQNALFVLDWTYGRIIALKMKRQGASWLAQSKEFARGQGDFGFAPTDAVVGPDGALYVSAGGRGTQGHVFRITYQPEQTAPQETPAERAASPVLSREQQIVQEVLQTPQPLAAWSRAIWEPQARRLREQAFIFAVADQEFSTAERIRALEILTELFHGPDIDLMRLLLTEPDRELRARAVWAYGRSVQGNPDPKIMARALQDTSPVVIRNALEVLLGCTDENLAGLEQPVAEKLGNEDHIVRQLAVQVATRMNNNSFLQVGEVARKTGWPEAIQMARSFVSRGYTGHPYAWYDIGHETLKRKGTPEQTLAAVLLIQHALGGFGESPVHPAVFHGYMARLPLPNEPAKLQAVSDTLNALYPTGDVMVDTEISRLAAMLAANNPALFQKLLSQITSESTAVDDLHILCCTACLPVARSPEQTQLIAGAFLNLSRKLKAANAPVDRNWEPRVAEIFAQHVAYAPTLPEILAKHPDFGQPEHTFFLSKLSDEFRPLAVDRLLSLAAEGQLELTPDILAQFEGNRSEQVLQLARNSLDDERLAPTAVLLLAAANEEQDRPVLLAELDSAHWEVTLAVLTATREWPAATPEQLARLIQLQQRLAKEKDLNPLWTDVLTETRKRAQELSQPAGEDSATLPSMPEETAARPEIAQSWANWLTQAFPEQATLLTDASQNSPWQVWEPRFTSIDWASGDAVRGEQVYHRQQCAQCHQGRTTVGPSLTGISQRFSPQDLQIAIVDPNRDVSPQFRTTLLTTSSGKTYTGIIIYESIDGLLLRDSTHRTVRIEASDIEYRRQLTSSLMPENLLKETTDQQIADLFAYLKTLEG